MRKLTSCPQCGVVVRKTQLNSHTQERCPNRPLINHLIASSPEEARSDTTIMAQKVIPKEQTATHILNFPNQRDSNAALCPGCNSRSKIMWVGRLPTIKPLCPSCYEQLSTSNSHQSQYYLVFRPIFERDSNMGWLLKGTREHTYISVATYIEESIIAIQYGNTGNLLLTTQKFSLLRLVDYLSSILPDVTSRLMTFERFLEEKYPDLEGFSKFRRSYERLMCQAKLDYDKYTGNYVRKSTEIEESRHERLSRLRFEIENSNTRITPALAQIENNIYWRILPPGEHPFPHFMAYFNTIHRQVNHAKYEPERLYKIYNLGSTSIYTGEQGFSGYVAFEFVEAQCAVLECPLSNNAIYVIKGDWRKLSQLTKAELLWQHESVTTRIIHNGNWISKLNQLLQENTG